MQLPRNFATCTFGFLACVFMTAAGAQSVDLRVTGIIAPAACSPQLSGGGVVDFGAIAASNLNATARTELVAKMTSLVVVCDASTQVAFTVTDNRVGTVADDIDGLEHYGFGLGMIGVAKIGGYELHVEDMTMDGSVVTTTARHTDDTRWIAEESSVPIFDNGTVPKMYSGTRGGVFSPPDAFQVMSVTLSVKPAITRANALPLTENVPLDGSATIALVYL